MEDPPRAMALHPSNDKTFRDVSFLSSLLVGFSMSFLVFILFMQTPVISRLRLAFAAFLFVSSAAAVYFIHFRWLNLRIRNLYLDRPGLLIFVLLVPLLFLPLIYTAPAFPVSPLLRPWTDVAVEFDNNSDSQSISLPADSVKLANGREIVDAQAFRPVGNWTSRENLFVLNAKDSGSFEKVGPASESVTFTVELPSGIGWSIIYWDRTRTIMDLTPNASRKVVLIKKFSTPLGIATIYFVVQYVLIAWIFLVVLVLWRGLPDVLNRFEQIKRFELLMVGIAVILSIVTVFLQVINLNGGISYLMDGQLEKHAQVLYGRAPDPWRYRIFAEVVAAGLIDLIRFFSIPNATEAGFIGLRILQNIAIFLLAFRVYKRLFSNLVALLGIALLVGAMLNVFYDADLSFNTYFDVIFYLLAILLILDHRYYYVAILMIFAAMNRETSGLIPFLVLAAIFDSVRPLKQKVMPVVLSFAVFLIVYGGLRFFFHSAPIYVPYGNHPGFPLLIYNVTRGFTWDRLFKTFGLIPLVGLMFFPVWPALWKRFFIVLCPVWFGIHLFLGVVAETRLFLVPYAVIFVPGVLFFTTYLTSKVKQPLNYSLA